MGYYKNMMTLKKIYLYFKAANYKSKLDIKEVPVVELDDIDEALYEEDAIVITDDCAFVNKTSMPFLIYLHDKNLNESFPTGAYLVEDLEEIDFSYIERIYNRFKGIAWKIMKTDRLSIEEITIKDVPRLKELYADKEITKYMEDLYPLEEEIEYTKKYIKNIYEFYGYGMWLMKLKATGEIIGRVGIESKDGFDGLELGFMVGKNYQHKGYAYEACKACIAYGVNELENHEFRAMVHKENEASKRLCKKLGFKEMDIKDNRIDFRMTV